jgi:hypothetical protein
MFFRQITVSSALLGLVAGSLAHAQDAAKPPSYQGEVLGVFNARCNSCHNADKKKGGLVLDNYAALMQGGSSGKVVEPGDADNSRLYLLIAHEEKPEMPPSSPKLPDPELAVLRKWIEAGAPENSGGGGPVKPKAKAEFKLDPSRIGKPVGEPAMPEGLSTEPVVVSPRPNAITALAHSPWAPLAAVAGHKQVLLYNSQTQQLIGVLPFPEGIVEVLKFTLDGDLLLAGGGRGGLSGRVVVWNVKTGERLFEVGKEYDTVIAADISPDRGLVALGGPSKVLRVYSSADGELVYECKKHTEWVTAAAFSPDGVLLASGDRNGGLLVWEAPTGREFYDLRNHTAMITDLAWRLDSNVLSSCSEDGSIRLWEMQNGGQIKTWGAHPGGAESVKFAKDGRLVSTGRDRVTKVWDQNGAAQKQLDPFPDLATRAVFNHDDTAVIAGDYSGEVRVHELAGGKRVGSLAANPPSVATRLELAQAVLTQARAEAETAAKELAKLQAEVEANGAAVAQAQAALDAATRAAADARAALTGAEQAYVQASAAEQAASRSTTIADEAGRRSAQLRDRAFQGLRAKAEAASLASATSRSDRDRQLADQATAALTAATRALETELPTWNSAIEAAGLARVSLDRATSARLTVEVSIPDLRDRLAVLLRAIAPFQAALTAAQQAKQSADKALVDATPRVQAAQAKTDSLHADVDRLAAEHNRTPE